MLASVWHCGLMRCWWLVGADANTEQNPIDGREASDVGVKTIFETCQRLKFQIPPGLLFLPPIRVSHHNTTNNGLSKSGINMRQSPSFRHLLTTLWLGLTLNQLSTATVESFSLLPITNNNVHGQRRTRNPRPKSLQIAATPSGDDTPPQEQQQVIEIETLSPNQLIELIELSFLQACLALSQGDVGPLQLFIVAVKLASVQKSALDLIKAVNQSVTSGRPLDQTEQDLRATWIQAIVLVLAHTDDDDESATSTQGLDKTLVEMYAPVLDDLVNLQKSGLGLNAQQFVQNRKELLLQVPDNSTSNNNVLLLEEEEEVDPVQLAIVTQTVKVMFYTLEVLADEEEEGQQGQSPKEQDSKQATKKSKKKKKSSGGGTGFG